MEKHLLVQKSNDEMGEVTIDDMSVGLAEDGEKQCIVVAWGEMPKALIEKLFSQFVIERKLNAALYLKLNISADEARALIECTQ